MMKAIDLRSDTITRPGPRMRAVMAEAEVGDDVYGEDVTVNRLEDRAAELLGTEAGLFVTSGTQGNLVALLTHCERGDGAILGSNSHIYIYEGGGLSAIGGILPLIVDDSQGIMSAESITRWVRPKDIHFAPAKLLCLENTHNRAGGVAVAPDVFAERARLGREHGLAVHLDGARVFNAAEAWGVDVKVFTTEVDSVQICLSKGLGAPVGSLLCGASDFIDRARHWRKRLGGGMRQAGIVAAAGLYALDELRSRLSEDHENAQRLSDLLKKGGVAVEESTRPTNMIYFGLPEDGPDADQVVELCAARGVLFNAVSSRRIRLVTHIDVPSGDIPEIATVIIEEAAPS